MNPNRIFKNYLRKNLAGKHLSAGELEDAVPQIYERWLDEPCEEMDWATPKEFFTSSGDCRALLKAALETIRDGEEPDYRIAARLEELKDSREILLRILGKGDTAQRGYAAKVLSARKLLPIGRFLDIALDPGEDGDIRETAIEALKDAADLIGNELFSRADGESEDNRKILAEIASYGTAGDERFLELVTGIMYGGDVAFAAQLFVRYGDPRAVYAMTPLLETADYADYIELRSAVISLGGEPGSVRDFDGDESLAEIRLKTGPRD